MHFRATPFQRAHDARSPGIRARSAARRERRGVLNARDREHERQERRGGRTQGCS